jgi:hypothetical protein
MEFSPPFSLLKLNFAKTAKQLCLLVLLKISKNITIKIQTKENILYICMYKYKKLYACTINFLSYKILTLCL